MNTETTLEQPGAPAVASSDLLAWEVEIHSMTCIVFAATKAKAQMIATKSYWDAYGRRKGEWPRAHGGRNGTTRARSDLRRAKEHGARTMCSDTHHANASGQARAARGVDDSTD